MHPMRRNPACIRFSSWLAAGVVHYDVVNLISSAAGKRDERIRICGVAKRMEARYTKRAIQ
jgi:hypothetical protein